MKLSVHLFIIHQHCVLGNAANIYSLSLIICIVNSVDSYKQWSCGIWGCVDNDLRRHHIPESEMDEGDIDNYD